MRTACQTVTMARSPNGPRLAQIFIAPNRGAPMQACERVLAEAGRGLVGDRYRAGTGTFSGRSEVFAGMREVSLIAAEAVRECSRRLDHDLRAADLRRNLVVEGLDPMRLRGHILQIGPVRLALLGGCPPCSYLSRLLAHDMRRGLAHIGGMRARIAVGGMLQRDAPIEILEKGGSTRIP